MLKKPDDDLFKDSTMTFGEHLEELRGALFRALLGLIVGCAIGLYFADWVVAYINSPLKEALEDYYQRRSIEIVENDFAPLSPAQKAALIEREMILETVFIEPRAVANAIQAEFPDQNVSLTVPRYHIASADIKDLKRFAEAAAAGNGPFGRLHDLLSQESRDTLAKGRETGKLTGSEYRRVLDELNEILARKDFYDKETFQKTNVSDDSIADLNRLDELNRDQLIELNWRLLHEADQELIASPHPRLVPVMFWRLARHDRATNPQSLGVQEGFMIWIKAGFITGFVLASPWVFYQLWMFVAAGLYPHEKKYVRIFLPFSLALFFGGCYLALFFVFQPVLKFLFDMNASLGIDPDPRIGEWLSFFLILPLGFGAAFQLPLLMLFFERIGIFSVDAYLSKWKIAILGIVILACVLTPADPVSFLFLGIPLLLLYFGGIGLCVLWDKATGKAAPRMA